MTSESLADDDIKMLRKAINHARQARKSGNGPFGAVLALPGGDILAECENEVWRTGDKTLHAELNLISRATRQYGRETIEKTTLYASTEPCGMCAGAIYWAGIKRVIFGCSIPRQIELSGRALGIRIYDVLSDQSDIEIIGPVLEDEAEAVFH